MVGGDGLQLRGTELEVTATERREMSVCVRVSHTFNDDRIPFMQFCLLVGFSD